MIRILVIGDQSPESDEIKLLLELLDQKGYASLVADEIDGHSTRIDGEFPDVIVSLANVEANLKVLANNTYLAMTPMIAIVDDLSAVEPLLELGAYDVAQRPINASLFSKQLGNCVRSEELSGQFESAKSKIREMAMYDSLTELLNRRYFLSQALRELARSLRFGHSYSMIIIEPDNFKQINDEKGSEAGDEVLKDLALICVDMARQIDLVGRLSGSEFVICCAETGSDGARVVADRILEKVERSVIPTVEGALEYGVSIGVSELGPLEMDISPLLKRADSALVNAKGKGGRRVSVELLEQDPDTANS